MAEKKYYVTIGLEIHAELNTRSKMFCSCANDPDEQRANINVCPVCMSHPGTLPVINKEAVSKVIKTGLALQSAIPQHSKFDRKNYFYPDLPKGYQISQYDMPLCLGGYLEVNGERIRITRIHLEEDTGRLIHSAQDDCSLVDFNRAGIPLMELVTEPDIHSAKEARKFAEELRLILRYLNVSNADMEKGQMRCEVNISLSKNPKKLGTKVEIKNLNSFRVVEKGIECEIKRQTQVLEQRGKIVQETRGWHDLKQKTLSQREKEESHDYRYFPEPDLPMLNIKEKEVKIIESGIPELPQARRERFSAEYGLSDREIEIFTQNKELGEYFEKTMSELRDWVKSADMKEKVERNEFVKLAKICSNYMITDLQGLLKNMSVNDRRFLITPENFAEFITLIHKKEILSKIAKTVLYEMFKNGKDPSHIIKKDELSQITDKASLEKIIKQVVSKNLKPVEDFKKGKENALQFLIGQVMKESKGKADPETAAQLLKKNLT
ncbi:Asp-tRNA(Asn)/Glu-tRNA(Gln) amidotransferase subunit GatB [Candidatus Parcubacteria bacterium]|nr:Asp-tRNA(Asn)/Glu-tRNA(Gln) amidotransferase subunit GatB [Candidatus Parcubacteria bacterium]